MTDRRLLRLEDSKLVPHAELGAFATFHTNDMVVDAQGRAYVGNLWDSALLLQLVNVAGIGFQREFAPYLIGLVLLLGMSGAQFSRLLFLGITSPDS